MVTGLKAALRAARRVPRAKPEHEIPGQAIRLIGDFVFRTRIGIEEMRIGPYQIDTSEKYLLEGERIMMRIGKAVGFVASAMLAGAMLVGGGAVATADEGSLNYELISGTPDGVNLWVNYCYRQDPDPEGGYWNGEQIHAGGRYGCNFQIEVSEEYEQEFGPYSVPADLVASTEAFRELGAPFAGVAPAWPFCAPGETPHYIGIMAAGEFGTYGSDMGGFHVNFFDAECIWNNEYPPDPEPPVMPEPEPVDPPVVVVEDPVLEEESNAEPVVEQEIAVVRAVPESVQTGVGAVAAPMNIAQAELEERAAVNGQQDLTIRDLLRMFDNAREEVTPVPVLSLPEPRSMPFSNVMEPATFDELWVVDDADNGYSPDGPSYFLAHTHTQGGAIGNAVNDAGLTPGAVIDVGGDLYDVTGVQTVAKPDIGALPIWQASDPDDAYLVVCVYNYGSLATHNLVVELHRS